MFSRIGFIALSVVLLSGVASSSPPECLALDPPLEDERHPDFVRQIHTVSMMRTIRMLLEEYEEDRGTLPTTLGPLTEYFRELPSGWACDGWGRPLIYFSWGSRFVLMSLGRNGMPEPQRSQKPRVVLEMLDYDTDIVMLDGDWVQTPRSVDI